MVIVQFKKAWQLPLYILIIGFLAFLFLDTDRYGWLPTPVWKVITVVWMIAAAGWLMYELGKVGKKK